jgi:hypothetical protein
MLRKAVAAFGSFLTIGSAGLPLTADAQTGTHRIGYIQTATPDEQAPLTKAFDEALRELGYVARVGLLLNPLTPGAENFRKAVEMAAMTR